MRGSENVKNKAVS